MNKCRSCQAEVIWVKTIHGKAMPIEINAEGNLILVKGVAHVIPKGEEPAGMPRYVSHFATCPNSKAHRKVHNNQ